MDKKTEQTVVYDKCPGCEGVWLDKSELEALNALSTAAGQAAGQGAGMVIGMMMAPRHH